MKRVLIDTSVVVGRVDTRDAQHARALALSSALAAAHARGAIDPIVPDCVAIEVVGVICRRRVERRDTAPLPDFRAEFPSERLARAYRLLDVAWDDVLECVRDSGGSLNAHDALLVVYARRTGIPFIATFDADLAVEGLRVLKSAEEVQAIT